jgi:transposase-like protein
MRKTFILEYTYQGYRPEVKQQVAEMAVNGSGIRDTSRVLKISPNTVIKDKSFTNPLSCSNFK